jgi:uncharacterized protein YprB with RNaseH-like and TPR domain
VSSTRERLERLYSRPKSRPAPEEDSLKKLETELLGRTSDGSELSLKERLERLVQVASSRPRSRPARAETAPVRKRRVVSLEEALSGREITNTLGKSYCVERVFPLHHRHGRIELERLKDVPREAFSVLARGSDGFEVDLERALFLDTETTGLAGGSGTYAFLIGLGFVSDSSFVVRQLFMRDYREEASMLRELAELASGYDLLVSYNGKSFDVPLLETRYVLTRQHHALEEMLHFDLLHPARSLWKARFESCRLSELESMLLGIARETDVPAHLIPEIYFRYVRTGDASSMPYVFEHNVHDLLSLAALTVFASDMLEEDHVPEDPIDDASLGRLFERVDEHDRSMGHYRRALESGLEGAARSRSLRRLAFLHKRRGEVEEARTLWKELAEEEGPDTVLALHELAMDCEHRERDFGSALSLCERALDELARSFHLPLSFREKWTEAFQHRRRRLGRRLAGRTRLT